MTVDSSNNSGKKDERDAGEQPYNKSLLRKKQNEAKKSRKEKQTVNEKEKK